MLGKIKDAIEAKKMVEEVSGKLEAHQQKLAEQTAAIEKLSGVISELTDTVSTLKSYSEEYGKAYHETIDAANGLKRELTSSVVNLQVIKGQLQSQIVSKVSEEMEALTEQFRGRVDAVGRIQDEISRIGGDMGALREEIIRFTALSTRIKDTDFQLTNYAQKLESNDKEKLQLMRQIDSLQRLVSNMRRQQRP